MTTTAESLQQALEHHRSGRLDDAERMYRQLLSADPYHAHATHLLGVVSHQRGAHPQALHYMQRAIQLYCAQV
jgi:tetratricopeptide (TPR) repeat protein